MPASRGVLVRAGGGGRDLIDEVAKAGGGVEGKGENQNEREGFDEQKDIRSLGLILSTLEARLGQREATRTLQHWACWSHSCSLSGIYSNGRSPLAPLYLHLSLG